jgi:hypothetical protein
VTLLPEALVFALFAAVLLRSERFGDLRKTQRAIPLGESASIEILLLFQLLKAGREVDCWKGRAVR